MPSEEGCSIPFPPGRRKLHIRSLLLPFQTGTISLGSGLADKWGCRQRRLGEFLKPFFSFSCRERKERVQTAKKRKRAGANRCPELDSKDLSHQLSVASIPTTRKVSALCASRRQKKPAALCFRRGGESSIFAGSFFLSKLRPLRWVTVWDERTESSAVTAGKTKS